MKICKKAGKAIADYKFPMNCPCCGTKNTPDWNAASTLYWRGTGCRPAYWYTCKKCGYKFNNGPRY